MNKKEQTPINGVKVSEGEGLSFRIRKLTERECFRLMGVHDEDIDTILGAGIPKSQLYKLAGNSIVAEGVLTGIFTKLFKDSAPTKGDQLKLF